MTHQRQTIPAALLVALGLNAAAANAEKMYWTDLGVDPIRRADLIESRTRAARLIERIAGAGDNTRCFLDNEQQGSHRTMAFVVLFVITAVLGAYGYMRGATRIGLALLPLLLASVFLWLFGPMFYRIDALRHAGLIWPGLILVSAGIIGGYIVQFFVRRKLPKKIHPVDRIGGSIISLILSLIVVWLGCAYFVVWSTSKQSDRAAGSASWLANALNTTVVTWIPGIGAGSDTMMNMMEIATAGEDIRRQAIEELGFDHLLDVPEMQAVFEDDETHADIQEAAKGSIAAVWRLQKSPYVLRLLESEEIAEVVNRRSLEDIAQAVRKAREARAEDQESDR